MRVSNKTNESLENQLRSCPVCGKPLCSTEQVHAKCAQDEPVRGERRSNKAPQKECSRCGHKTHVRKLECPQCGELF